MDPRSHWDHIYQTKKPSQLSWFRPHLEKSLELILSAAPDPAAQIIDVGAGESTLVDDLLARGYRHINLLDISESALAVTRRRLGKRAAQITWLAGDVTTIDLPSQHYDLWHDRAVFHFLTSIADRQAYVRQVAHSVKSGGHVIVASFGPEGPQKCSGLDVVRYDPASLHNEFGPHFQLLHHLTEHHMTPAGALQQFVYCFCKLSH